MAINQKLNKNIPDLIVWDIFKKVILHIYTQSSDV